MMTLGSVAHKDYKVKNVALPQGLFGDKGGESDCSDYNDDDFQDLMTQTEKA